MLLRKASFVLFVTDGNHLFILPIYYMFAREVCDQFGFVRRLASKIYVWNYCVFPNCSASRLHDEKWKLMGSERVCMRVFLSNCHVLRILKNVDDSWGARFRMRVFSTPCPGQTRTRIDESWEARVEKRKFAWEFSQLFCSGQTRMRVEDSC